MVNILKRLVVSNGEARLYELAKAVFGSGSPTRVHLKVRLADVFDVDLPMWTGEEHWFLLAAHFDLLITNEDLQPKLAVEYDGSSHQTPVQVQRDCLKDIICQKARLPIQRVGWEELRRPVELAQRLRNIYELRPRINLLERILCLQVSAKLAGLVLRERWMSGNSRSYEGAEDVVRLAKGFKRTHYLRPTGGEAEFWISNYSPAMDCIAGLPDSCQTRWRYQVLSVVIDRFLVTERVRLSQYALDSDMLSVEVVHWARIFEHTLYEKGFGP